MLKSVIQGVDPGKTAEDVLQSSHADVHAITSVRPLGNKGAFLLTFEGEGISCAIKRIGRKKFVHAYRPMAIVCNSCHMLGHKSNICTRQQRCGTCGEIKNLEHRWQQQFCVNCKAEDHTAFSRECQAKLQADRKRQQRARVPLRKGPAGATTSNRFALLCKEDFSSLATGSHGTTALPSTPQKTRTQPSTPDHQRRQMSSFVEAAKRPWDTHKTTTSKLQEIKRMAMRWSRVSPPPPPPASLPQRPSNGKTQVASQPMGSSIDKGSASHTGEIRTTETAPRNQYVATKAVLTAVKHAYAEADKKRRDNEDRKKPTMVMIFTDSEEVLRACKEYRLASPTVREIMKTAIRARGCHGIRLQQRWVPGHSGVKGSEAAHVAAREHKRFLLSSANGPLRQRAAEISNGYRE
ncbi:hypothetical protein HPB47_005353 [Ixodes persulcatus]|uniref:Uncharacterized protein n=1 Tax=Ixodes persulcatus TaxID=34615 RepID=A0AC60PEH2_IXOPE|nr:hypothetical protein HPB47_005353 [Ixodes persulcatus]